MILPELKEFLHKTPSVTASWQGDHWFIFLTSCTCSDNSSALSPDTARRSDSVSNRHTCSQWQVAYYLPISQSLLESRQYSLINTEWKECMYWKGRKRREKLCQSLPLVQHVSKQPTPWPALPQLPRVWTTASCAFGTPTFTQRVYLGRPGCLGPSKQVTALPVTLPQLGQIT